jgi:8-oxo-dGTP pyrophosphatase MutT (NUDIX family)
MGENRNKNVPASYLFLMKDNKILLQRRFNTGYEDGKYSMVAGHVDKGETFTEAIIREVKEEAGIELKLEDLKVVHIMHRDSRAGYPEGVAMGINQRIDTFFTADKWDGEIENKEPQKCDDLSWFDLDNLPKNIIPYVKHAIDCIKNKIFYSEYGWK